MKEFDREKNPEKNLKNSAKKEKNEAIMSAKKREMQTSTERALKEKTNNFPSGRSYFLKLPLKEFQLLKLLAEK